MSGAVLGVTLLAGMATLGASLFIVKGENKELQERKADEAFAKSKLPYDFSLNRDGIERLRNLRGPLLLQAVKDPRMDSDRISRIMTDAEFEELAQSREDVPQLLKEAPETKMRDLVERLFKVLQSSKGGMASGKVVAWVMTVHPNGITLLDGESNLRFSEAVSSLMEMYTDTTFRYKDRCRVALSELINKKAKEVGVGRAVADNDAFLRVFPDNRAMAKVMSYMDSKSSTQLANMEVVKRVMFDEQDLRFLISDLGSGPVAKFMKDYYMPRFAVRINVTKDYRCDSEGNFTAVVGASGANVVDNKIVDDKVENTVGLTVTENNRIKLTTPPPVATGSPVRVPIKITVKRAFDYEDKIDIRVSQ